MSSLQRCVAVLHRSGTLPAMRGRADGALGPPDPASTIQISFCFIIHPLRHKGTKVVMASCHLTHMHPSRVTTVWQIVNSCHSIFDTDILVTLRIEHILSFE